MGASEGKGKGGKKTPTHPSTSAQESTQKHHVRGALIVWTGRARGAQYEFFPATHNTQQHSTRARFPPIATAACR